MKIENKTNYFINIDFKPEKIKMTSNYIMLGGVSK